VPCPIATMASPTPARCNRGGGVAGRPGVDWRRVRADVLEHRGDTEARIAQEYAELRASGGRVVLKFQERVARLQANIDAVDHLLAVLERQGV
jgi:hypothetical protein